MAESYPEDAMETSKVNDDGTVTYSQSNMKTSVSIPAQ
jgi:hypothetical protein